MKARFVAFLSSPTMFIWATAVIGVGILIALLVMIIAMPDIRAAAPPPTPTPDPFEFDVPLETAISIHDEDSELAAIMLASPAVLEIGPMSWRIIGQRVTGDNWRPHPGAETAVWVYGSLVNHIIFLGQTNDAQNLLETMSEGDPLTLTMGDGRINEFRLTGRQTFTAGQTANTLFNQNSPALTLVMALEGDQRLVITAANIYQQDDGELTIAYDPPPLGPLPEITLTGADISPDSTALVVNGAAVNNGDQDYVVTAEQITLESDGRAYLLLTVSPPLPWRVLPGEQIDFELAFFTPANTALFTLDGWLFELEFTYPEPEPEPTPEPEEEEAIEQDD